MLKKTLKVQNFYTSFLLWTDNNYLSNSTLYKDFTAHHLVKRSFIEEKYSGKTVLLPKIGL